MDLQIKDTAQGDTVYYTGSLDHTHILLIVGRDNFGKDELFIQSLITSLRHENWTIVYFEYKWMRTEKILNEKTKKILSHFEKYPRIKRVLGWIAKSVVLLQYPNRYDYFLPDFLNINKSVSKRASRLRKFVRSFKDNQNINIISRSAGSRVSSLIENEPAIKRIVCISYPFKHPKKSDERNRVSHLKNITKPFLIIQGSNDEYGGAEVVNKYKLSPSISFRFFDTTHDFKVTKEEQEKLFLEIKQFILSQIN